MPSTPIDDKQAARLRVLNAFYELSDGDPLGFIEPEDIEKHTGLSAKTVNAATRYLRHEGLVEERALGGTASITHEGVVEVERARQQPSQPTAHFQPGVIQYVFNINAPVGAMQTGAGSTANVTQNLGFSADEVVRLIGSIQRAIPPDRAELREVVGDLEEEVKKPQPKPSKIRAYLTSARDLAKDIGPLVPLLTELAKALLGS